MQSPRRSVLTLATLAALVAGAPGPARAEPPPTMPDCDLVPVADPETVSVETPLGTLEIELYSNVAPLTVANFLGYIDRGDYADSVVHRSAPGFVIQAGGFRFRDGFFEAIETQDPIANEPCLSNVAGTLAMAKLGGQPDSATSQWFVNLVDNSANLDTQNGGFTVFGRVLGDGLVVADAIGDLPDRPPLFSPYLAAVRPESWQILRDSPLTAPLGPIVDGDYGCFDPTQSGIVFVEEPVDRFDWEPDSPLGLGFVVASRACETNDPGAPFFTCQDPGRRVLRVTSDGALESDPMAPFGFAEDLVSCEGLAASEASYAARLQGIAPQLDAVLVHTAYAVPEPGSATCAAAALAALALLRRRRR